MLSAEHQFIICSTPRSGNNYLRRLVQGQTGYLPREYGVESSHFGSDALLEIRDDFWGCVLFWQNKDKFIRDIKAISPSSRDAEKHIDTLKRVFPKLEWIWLSRESKLNQAISFVRAQQTDLYVQHVGGDQRAEKADPKFDFEAIEKYYTQFHRHNAHWADFFYIYNIEPIIITYEQLDKDPAEVLRKCIPHICNNRQFSYEAYRESLKADYMTKKLRDTINSTWALQFNEEYFKRGRNETI